MSKLNEFLSYFELSRDDFDLPNLKAFQDRMKSIKGHKIELSESTFKRYRKELNLSKCNKKHPKDITRHINRNNYVAIDGTKLNDIGIVMFAKIRNKKTIGFVLGYCKIPINKDYHALETIENMDKIHQIYQFTKYSTVSDNHRTYKTYFYDETKHTFIKNKNSSTSPERRVKDLKRWLGKTASYEDLNRRVEFLSQANLNIELIKL